jgi:hypothetical protein
MIESKQVKKLLALIQYFVTDCWLAITLHLYSAEHDVKDIAYGHEDEQKALEFYGEM